MKLFKRAAALLLCGALLLGALIACNTGTGGKAPVTITMWHYYNGAQQETLKQMIDEFNETVGMEKGIVVEAHGYGKIGELTQNTLDALYKKVGAQAPPDLFAAYADTAYEINAAGMAADIGQYLTKAEQQAYIPAYLDEGRFDETGFKIFPVAKAVELLTVNKTEWALFAADTGASDEGLATWEGLADIAAEYYAWTDALTPDAPNDGKAFFGRDAFANYMIIGSKQLGVELFEAADGKATFHVDEAVMRRLWDNFYVPYISGYYAAYGKFRSDDVRTGDIAAFVGSTSGATYFPSEVTRADGTTYPIEGKVYALPNFAGTSPTSVQQGAGMVVTKSTKEKEKAAVEFLKWFTATEQNVRFCGASGYLPVTAAANTAQAISDGIAAKGEGITPILRESLLMGVQMTGTYELYTSAPFAHAFEARGVVEDSMHEQCEEGREAVLARLAEGMTLADAVAQGNTDEAFRQWLGDFEKDLKEVLTD